MPSRRTFLGATGGTLGIAGGLAAGWTGTVDVPHLSPAWQRWHYAGYEDVIGTAFDVRNGRLFAAERHGLVAVDAASGERQWSLENDERPYFGVYVDDDGVYSGDESIVAATYDGEPRWRVDLEDRFEEHASLTARPVSLDGRLFAGVERGILAAFDAEDGSPAWSADVGEWRVRSLGATRGRVFAALRHRDRNDGRLVGFDAATGDHVWERTASDWKVNLVGDDVVYAAVGQSGGAGGFGVTALDPADGTDIWRYQLVEVNGMTHHGDTVYAVAGRGDGTTHRTPSGALVAIDAATGDERWRRDTRLYGALPPAVGDGRIYVASRLNTAVLDERNRPERARSGTVLAYTTDGDPLWRYPLGEHDQPFAPPVYRDGLLYVCGHEGVTALAQR